MKPAIFSPLTVILLVALIGVTLAGYVFIPAGTPLPVHWGLDGQADRFLPRDLALAIAPAIAALFLAISLLATRLLALRQIEAGRHIWQALTPTIVGLFLALQVVIVLVGLGVEVPAVRIIAIALAIQLIVLGNVLPKSRPNTFAGIRLPWTLADDANWLATHRLTGMLMLIAGVVLGLAAMALQSAPILLIVLLAAALLPVVAGTAFSYMRSRR